MPQPMRKCISMGPAGYWWPGPGQQQDLRFGKNVHWFQDTRTGWIRFWIHWPDLQYTNTPIDPNHPHLLELDDQIRGAREVGLRVILCLHHEYPFWANGRTDWDARYVPTDLSATGPWGQFIDFVYRRYKPFGPSNSKNTHIDLFEIVNEPNLGMKPQRDSNGNLVMPGKVVQMLNSARTISERYDHQLFIGGPSLSDKKPPSEGHFTYWAEFVDAMSGLRAAGNFVFTHHNYLDVEQGTGSTKGIRSRIGGWWTGYDEGDGPVVFATEGGGRMFALPDFGASSRQYQSNVVVWKYDELRGSQGIGMQSNYLTYDEPTAPSSGLANNTDGVEWPVYYGWRDRGAGGGDVHRWHPPKDLGQWVQWDAAMLSQHDGHLEIFAIGGDRNIYNRWSTDHGNSWAPWGRIDADSASAPAAISIRDQTMDLFVVAPNRVLYQQWWNPVNGWQGWHERGGQCTSDPAVGSMNDRHIQVFVRGTDNFIHHRWWWSDSGWSNWYPLNTTVQSLHSPSAVSWGDKRMDVVWTANDRTVRWMYWDDPAGVWRGPNNLGGSATGAPEIVSWKAGHLDVIVGGSGSKLWRRSYDRGVWGPWHPIPHTYGHQFSPGAISPYKGRIDLAFVRGNAMQHMSMG